ncbi:hypothetical protein ACFY5H_33860 [Streptomyces sp. NPDC013012]|uniref:hypothetical protein n=1 Tax=Streptomyces sp. NPDC013012 TaxID=3364860 RepID=UPI00369AA2AC
MSATLPPADDWIRGISVKQPWAACIAAGAKTIENRSQPVFMDSSMARHGF